MKKLFVACSVAAALAITASCGGGGGSTSMTTPTPSSPMPAAIDAFTQVALAIVANPSNTASPVPVDGFAVVTVDNGPPVEIY